MDDPSRLGEACFHPAVASTVCTSMAVVNGPLPMICLLTKCPCAISKVETSSNVYSSSVEFVLGHQMGFRAIGSTKVGDLSIVYRTLSAIFLGSRLLKYFLP